MSRWYLYYQPFFNTPREKPTTSFLFKKSYVQPVSVSLSTHSFPSHHRVFGILINVKSVSGSQELCSTRMHGNISLNSRRRTQNTLQRITFVPVFRYRKNSLFLKHIQSTSMLFTVRSCSSQTDTPQCFMKTIQKRKTLYLMQSCWFSAVYVSLHETPKQEYYFRPPPPPSLLCHSYS